MKIFEYGHYFIVMADGNQYIIDGDMGYKNAPWSKLPPNKVYIAKIDNGKVTAADIIEANSTFSGKISKAEKWDQELYNIVERRVLMEAMSKIIGAQPLVPSNVIMHQDTFKDVLKWSTE